RNAISQMESCLVDEPNFGTCSGSPEITAFATVTVGGTAAAYTVESTSKSGNKFRITKAGSGVFTRACDTGGSGGCPTGGSW
ncbi:MAG TPA: hypothetical protein VNT54_18385, partial [Solirubrobacteraceae bacterium]|nr:hypothetical protein [Solirubrobacteraceae bacterium]